MLLSEISKLIPNDFNDNSSVWIYQSNRAFNENEKLEIESELTKFLTNWKSHGSDVKGWSCVFLNRFIVLMADDTIEKLGGCSIDDSMIFVKGIEKKYGVQIFDRLLLTFFVNGKIENLPLNQLQYAIDKGYINADTLYFNNLANSKKELLENWVLPIQNSWLSRRVKFPVIN